MEARVVQSRHAPKRDLVFIVPAEIADRHQFPDLSAADFKAAVKNKLQLQQ
jgi:hypothetical protein